MRFATIGSRQLSREKDLSRKGNRSFLLIVGDGLPSS
jgi:hypothetical protein